MTIDKKYKIEEATSKDPRREVLHAVHVAKVNGSAKAIATDGRMLAMVPVEMGDRDSDKVNVRREAFQAARKTYKRLPVVHLELNGKAMVTEPGSERAFDYIDGQYPNFEPVLPKAAEKSVSVTIDANLLVKLWKALGGEADTSPGITLKIGCVNGKAEQTRPIEVNVRGTDGYGLLMQMRTE
jgi:DNA polymerase III sliding clamp (beta) subunit (PCNA family)